MTLRFALFYLLYVNRIKIAFFGAKLQIIKTEQECCVGVANDVDWTAEGGMSHMYVLRD